MPVRVRVEEQRISEWARGRLEAAGVRVSAVRGRRDESSTARNPTARAETLVAVCGLFCVFGSRPQAAAPPAVHGTFMQIVINAAALSGSSVPLADTLGNVQVLSAASLSQQGSTTLTGALNAHLSSININDNLADPLQPDILYRRLPASPMLGTPQGFAVYENGVRFNEAFGDTFNWDLMLPSAIHQLELSTSSAIFGLNALRGAISLTMKNGVNYHGGEVQLSGDSFHRQDISAQYGMPSGMFAVYIAVAD